MKYFSTRDKSLEFSFKDIFLRGLAPEGGLFLPSKIIIPSFGLLIPLTVINNVDLPAPLAPISETISPVLTLILTSLRA